MSGIFVFIISALIFLCCWYFDPLRRANLDRRWDAIRRDEWGACECGWEGPLFMTNDGMCPKCSDPVGSWPLEDPTNG